jgi:hypothetical protein
MKALLSLLLVFAIPVSVEAQTEDGFRGFRWGTSVDGMIGELGLTPVAEGYGTSLYRSSITSVGGVELERCVLGFYNGKFYSFALMTNTSLDSHALLDLLKESFGPPVQVIKESDEYWWDELFDDSYAFFGMQGAEGGYFTMCSRSVMKEMEEGQHEAQ